MDSGDHPKLDTSPMLDDTGTKIFQSLIGAFQWAITLGRWDIMTAVMTLSSFQALPRVGHLERVKQVYNYLMNYQFFKIRFDTREQNHEDVVVKKHDWKQYLLW